MPIKTLRASGGDFSTLEAWVAYLPATLTEDEVLECYNDWPSGLDSQADIPFLSGTDIYSITIRAAAGHGNDGVIGQGVLIKKSGHWTPCIISRALNVHVQNITCEKPASTAGYAIEFQKIQSSTCSADSVIVKVDSSSGAGFFSNRAVLTNCIAYDSYYGFRGIYNYGLNLYNCLIVNCTYGLHTTGGSNDDATGLELVNNIWFGCTNDVFGDNVHYVANVKNNASNSTNAQNLGADVIRSITSADFIDSAGMDFSLSSTSAMKGTGFDNSALFTTDITNAIRTVPWDIGPYKASAPGGAGVDLSTQAYGTGQATFSLFASAPLSVSATSESIVQSALTAPQPGLSVNLSGQSTTSVSLAAAAPLSAVATSESIVQSALTAPQPGLSVNLSGQSTTSVSLAAAAPLSVAATSESIVQSALTAPQPGLSVNLSGQSMTSVSLAAAAPLSAVATSESTVQAGLVAQTQGYTLSSVCFSNASVYVGLEASAPLSSVCESQSNVYTALVQGTTTLSGKGRYRIGAQERSYRLCA